jgi:hypothetical protein
MRLQLCVALPCLQSAQREDASTTRLFRNLWLYTAMHKLVNPAAGIAAISDDINAAAAAGKAGGVVAEWQMAAGRLAAVTPLLVVGTDSYIEADMVERLKVRVKARSVVVVMYLRCYVGACLLV